MQWTAFIVISRASALRFAHTRDILAAGSRARRAGAVALGRLDRARAAAPLQTTARDALVARPVAAAAPHETLVCGLQAVSLRRVRLRGRLRPAAHGSVLLPGMLPLWTAGCCASRSWDVAYAPAAAGGARAHRVRAALVGARLLLAAFDRGDDLRKGDLCFLAGSACCPRTRVADAP
jgi:hypothetical protein